MKPMLSLLLLAALSAPAALAQSARELMDKARDRTAAATAVKRVDSAEVFVTVPGRPRQGPQRTVVTIEIDQARHLARQTGAIEGKDLVLLKQGDRAAIQVGTGDWQ